MRALDCDIPIIAWPRSVHLERRKTEAGPVEYGIPQKYDSVFVTL